MEAAAVLPTPRTVKKFTNLYRLLRAGLDEYTGELDRFLDDEHDRPAEYQAVLILLAMIIAFPEEASDVLLALLAPFRSWDEFVKSLEDRGELEDVAKFFTKVTAKGATGWTTEPFGRWALEVSRYSFETGQEVFSSVA